MNKLFSLILILSISSCSSIAFWQSDEIDPDEPRAVSYTHLTLPTNSGG